MVVNRVLARLLPVLCLCVAAPAAPFLPLGESTHAQWDQRLGLDGETAALRLLGEAAGRGYLINLRPTGAALYRLDPAEVPLSRSATPWTRTGTHELVLRRRDAMLYLLIDGVRVLEALDGTWHTGKLSGQGKLKAADGGYQPVEDIGFSDDFMRTEDNQQLGVWQHLAGKWRFYSVHETNPNANVKLSINPFSLGLTATDKPAAVMAGQRFWDDYEYQVSIRGRGAGWAGVIFGLHNGRDYFLLRADLREAPLAPRRVELVRVKDDKETVLAAGTALLSADQWYRLGVRTRGSRLQCLLDSDVIFDRVDPDLSGGPIGLWTDTPKETLFDDVLCSTNFDFPCERAGTLTQWGSPAGGSWRQTVAEGDPIAGDPGPRQLSVAASDSPARYTLGDPAGTDFRLDTTVKADRAGTLGLLCGWRDERNYFSLEWDMRAGELNLCETRDGERRRSGYVHDLLTPGESHTLAVDLTLDKRLLVYRDGLLRLRTTFAPVPGRLGLLAVGTAATFGKLDLRRSVAVDSEIEIDNANFANDPFMLHWASSLADWYPAGGPEGNPAWVLPPKEDPGTGTPEIFWHKGDFYQAYRLELPVNHGDLAVLLNATEEQWAPPADDVLARRPLRLEAKDAAGKPLPVAGDGYCLVLSGAGPGARGSQLTLYRQGQRMQTCAVPADLKSVTVGHDGGVTWVEGGDRDLLVYHDPKPLRGPRVALRVARGSLLWQVHCRRAGIIDEVFEKAPADWVQQGEWIITNRFSCTPTWSHMTGLARKGLSAIWHKAAFPGNVTIEYYAGMRMQSDLGTMYYPRPGDFNTTFGCKPFDLDSGLSLLPGAWDPAWSGVWTRYAQGRQTIVQTDRDLVPHTREDSGHRSIPVPYISAGRDIHGAWYYVKSRCVDGKLEALFDNAKILAGAAPPLAGDRVAFWTQDDQIVLARVRITYANKVIPRRLVSRDPLTRPAAPAAPPVTVLASLPDQGGLAFDWQGGLDGWSTRDPWRGVALSATTVDGRRCLLARNQLPGDSFEAIMPLAPPTAAVALTKGAGPAPVQKRRRRAAGTAAAFSGALDLSHVAQLSFDYRIAPEAKVNLYLTVNDRALFVPLSGPRDSSEVLTAIPAPAVTADGQWHTLSFDLAAALRGVLHHNLSATVRKQLGEPPLKLTDLRFGMRHEGYLLAGFGGNPTGASYALANFALVPTLAAGAALEPQARLADGQSVKELSEAFDEEPAAEPKPDAKPDTALKMPAEPGLHRLFVRGKLADGRWTPAAQLPVLTANSTLTALGETDYDGGPLELSYTDPAPTALDVTVAGLPLLGAEAIRLDVAAHRLVLDAAAVRPVYTDGQKLPVQVQAFWADGRTASLNFERVFRLATSRRVPLLPVVQGAGVQPTAADLVAAASTVNGTTIDATVDPADGPLAGDASVKLTNLRLGGAFTVPLLSGETDLGKLPLLMFDYKTTAPVRNDFLLSVAGESYELGFTDNAGVYRTLTSVDDAKRDGQWHRATLDLRRALVTRSLFAPGMYRLLSVSSGDLGYSGEVPGASWKLANLRLVRTVSGARGFEVKASSYDPGGIARWRWALSASEQAQPDHEQAGAEFSHTFQDAPAGLQWLNLQAVNAAGVGSPICRTPLLVVNTPPAFGAPTPAAGPLGTSRVTLSVTGGDPAQLDPASVRLSAGAQTVGIKPGDVEYDAATGQLLWHWCWATRQFSGPVADGTPVPMQVTGNDQAGNFLAPLRWDTTVSYAADKEPPPAPEVTIAEQPLARFDGFGPGSALLQYGQYQSMEQRRWDPDRRDWVAQCQVGHYGTPLTAGPVDLDKYPYCSFDYKAEPGVLLHLLALVNSSAWYAITLNGKSRSYPPIGEAEFKADGAWHTLVLNLRQFTRGITNNGPATVTQLVFNEYGSGAGRYWLDNVAFFGPSPRTVTANWVDYDSSGIAAAASRFDSSLDAPAPADLQPGSTSGRFTAPEHGTYLLQVRCRDGAGNVGGVARRVVVVP